MFSRVLYGTKYSLGLGLAATAVSLIFGMILGSPAGYYGGVIDEGLMRFCDITQSIPGMFLNMALCVAFGTGTFSTILALGVGGIASSARLMRASFLNLRKAEFVEAARSINCSDGRIIIKHIIPNAFAPLPEWGAMLSGGRDFIRKAPWICIFPGCCIPVLVLSLNLVGDSLRDALDPKLKKSENVSGEK